MEQEEREALEALRKMEAWKKAQAEKERDQENIFNKSKLDQARQRADHDESAASGSMAKGAEESYSSDPFEEVSVSGSGDKVNNIWTRNKDGKKLASSSSDKYDDDFESISKSKSESLMDSKKDSSRSA